MANPNALIIGVQKAATTWLAARLGQHPDVCMVPYEIHFFDHERNYRKGPSWYESHFRRCAGQRVRCEKTGAYFWTACYGKAKEPDDKPERIRALLPHAKLIVILRNPVSRAISAWNHNLRSGNIPFSYDIEKVFAPSQSEVVAHHGILTRGLYYQQLTRWWSVFPKNQMLVLFQEEDVEVNPLQGLQKVCAFLGIDVSFGFSSTDSPENRFGATRLGTRLASVAPGPIRKPLLRVDRHILTRLPLERLSYPKPSEKLKNHLFDYYSDDIAELSKVLGPLPPSWKAHSQ
jgi:hypothetical protein